MQMWMIWMIWIVFLAVMFGIIADAISECKGFARSWFYKGLFLGPVAILILLRKPDPEGQVQYVDPKEAVSRGPSLMRDPRTGMMIPSMVSDSDRRVVFRTGHHRDGKKLMQIGAELACIAVILRLVTLVISFFTNESEGEGLNIILGFSALILLFVTCMLCTENNKRLALGLVPLLLTLVAHSIDMSRLIDASGKHRGFSYGWEAYGWYIISNVICLVCFFLVVLNTQSTPTEVSEEEEEGGKQKRSRLFWAPIALAAASSLMLVNRIIQGAVEAGEYTGMKSANTGFTVWGILLSTLISCCFYLSYLCIAIREGIAKNG